MRYEQNKKESAVKKKRKYITWEFMICVLLLVIFKQLAPIITERYFTGPVQQVEASKNFKEFVSKVSEDKEFVVQVDENLMIRVDRLAQILVSKMTKSEHERYYSIFQKVGQGKATKADRDEMGLIIGAVIERLPENDRLFVLKAMIKIEESNEELLK